MKAPFKINPSAQTVHEICLEEHKITKLYNTVYTITVLKKCSRMERKKSYIIKTYTGLEFIKNETENLLKLHRVKGVPKLYYSSIMVDPNLEQKDSRKIFPISFPVFPFYYTIIERVPATDLFELQKGTRFPLEKLREIFRQILTILVEIHKKGIIHQDIKEENILYSSEENQVYIIDFEGKKTLHNQSPEQVEDKKLTEKTDIWSLGTAFYSSLTGYEMVASTVDIMFKPLEKMLHRLDRNLPDSLFDLFECMLDRSPDTRYSASECLNHEFFQEM